MTRHLLRDLEQMKKEILTVGAMVESVIDKAITALLSRRQDLAEEVVRGDDLIDQKEVQVETDCLKLMALHQPVAGDLRFLIAVLKVNNDLERMGDHAVNIAERAMWLSTKEPIQAFLDFPRMADTVRTMVRDSLDSLVGSDTTLARRVCQRDAEVDRWNRQAIDELQALMMRDSEAVPRALQTLSVTRNLERIADLATNIAEDVIFMVEGDIVRHRLLRPVPKGGT